MRSYVVNQILIILLYILAPIALQAQKSCTCEPSPPGGITTCPKGWSAICHTDKGICKGVCDTVQAQFAPLIFYRNLLSLITGASIQDEEITRYSSVHLRIIDSLLVSDNLHKTVTIEYGQTSFRVNVSLPTLAVEKLEAATSQLREKGVLRRQ